MTIFVKKKITKLENRNLVYKPNPNIFDCLVKYNKKKTKYKFL